MQMTFRPLAVWPRPDTPRRRGHSVFSAAWSTTIEDLDRELRHLGAESVIIQADFREQDIRLDGLPRGDARAPQHPGIVINFESHHGPLQYMTDAYDHWRANVRAIALGLEALRAVDRHGITSTGEQYTGFRQLTAGSSITSSDAARTLITDLVTGPGGIIQGDLTREHYRRALKVAHPDHGGSTETLAAVRDAGRLLGVA